MDESRSGRDEGAGFFDPGKEGVGCGLCLAIRSVEARRTFLRGLIRVDIHSGALEACEMSV